MRFVTDVGPSVLHQNLVVLVSVEARREVAAVLSRGENAASWHIFEYGSANSPQRKHPT